MFEKIRLWWKFEGRYYHKNFIYGVKNLYRWFPIVWKDRNYDHHYIYNVLKFKLEQQAFEMASRDRHTTTQTTVEKMLLCARLCQIQMEDLYGTEYLDYIKEDHKFVPTGETPPTYTVDSIVLEDNLDEYFTKYPKQYKKVLEGKVTWYGRKIDPTNRKHIALYIAEENQNRSRKLLFKILEENIEGFWD